jgi:hypothetical protein
MDYLVEPMVKPGGVAVAPGVEMGGGVGVCAGGTWVGVGVGCTVIVGVGVGCTTFVGVCVGCTVGVGCTTGVGVVCVPALWLVT